MAKISRNQARQKKHLRVRANIFGTALKPRVSVYKSLQHFEVQAIDDSKGVTLAHSSTISLGKKYGGNIASATEVGLTFAKKLAELKITEIVFDRGGYIYHGRVAAFAETLRKEGVKF